MGVATAIKGPGSLVIHVGNVDHRFSPTDVVRIGCHPACAVQLEGPNISPIHVAILVSGDAWTLVNLGYKGTLVAGRPIDRHTLDGALEIRVGGADGVDLGLSVTPLKANA